MSDAEISSKHELENENSNVSQLSENDQEQLQQQVETIKPSRAKKNKLAVPKKKICKEKKKINDTQSDDMSHTDESEEQLNTDESESDMSTEEHQNGIESQEKEKNPRRNLIRDTTKTIWTDQDLSTAQQEMLDAYLQLKHSQSNGTLNANIPLTNGSNPLEHLEKCTLNLSTTYSSEMTKKEQEIEELRAEIERLRFENTQLKSTQKTTDEITYTNIIENGYKLEETPKINEIKIFEPEIKQPLLIKPNQSEQDKCGCNCVVL